jgi:parallel beta-helix repeat protein/putative cofactor-binding repeat protein
MKKSVFVVSSVIIFLMSLSVSSFAAIRCVNPAGTGGCYTTIQAAVDAANPFDRILIKPDVYYENVNVETNNLTITSTSTYLDPTGRLSMAPTLTDVIVDAFGGCDSEIQEAFNISSNNVTLTRLTVRHSCGHNIYSNGNFTLISEVNVINAGSAGVGIDGDSATVRNSTFRGNGDWAIEIYGETAKVQNNQILQSGEGGLYLEGDYASITGNTIYNSEDDDCIEAYSDNALISNNKIASCDGDGIYFEGDDSTVSSNNIQAVSDDGIDVEYSDNTVISNNTISGTDYDSIYAYDSDNLTITSNILNGALDGESEACLLDLYDLYNSTITLNTGDYGVCGLYSYSDCGEDDCNTISFNTMSHTSNHSFEIVEDQLNVIGNTGRYTTDADIFSIYCYSNAEEGGCIGGKISGNYAAFATNDENGFHLDVNNMTISGNTAERNIANGFEIEGDNNTISGNISRHNGSEDEAGFDISGAGNTVTGNTAEYNDFRGFELYAYGTMTVSNNISRYNTGAGFSLDARRNALHRMPLCLGTGPTRSELALSVTKG